MPPGRDQDDFGVKNLSGNLKGESILVVSPSARLRNRLSLIINRLGYLAVMACDGDEAFSRLKTQSFDFIISDLKMPKMSGLALLWEVKKRIPSLPFIICASNPSIEAIMEAVKLGASYVIQYPCGVRQVEKALKSGKNGPITAISFVDLSKSVAEKRELKSLNARLKRRIKKLTALYLISEALEKENGLQAFDSVADLARRVTEARNSAVMLYDRDNGQFFVESSSGDTPAMGEELSFCKESIKSFQRNGPGVGFPAASHQAKALSHELKKRAKKKGFMAVPLMIRDEILGVVVVAKKMSGQAFTNYDFFLLENLAKKASMKIENEALYDSIYTNLMETLKALVFTIEAKDPYTRHHSERVTRLSMILAEEMNLGAELIDTIRIAGFLHDIGKIGIPDSILQKQGRLTSEEYAVIQTHPVIGEKIVKHLGLLPQERAIIRHHHERWDGRGVPDGLCKENIPLEARVLSLADAYDAMVSDRPYRKGKTVAETVRELDECSGSQFDPSLIHQLKRILNKGLVEDLFLDDELLWSKN